MSERRQVLIDLITRTQGGTQGIKNLRTDLGGVDASARGATKSIQGIGGPKAQKGLKGVVAGAGGARYAMGGLAAAGLAVGVGMKSAVDSFARFDDKMAQSQAIMGNLTQGEMAAMETAARNVAKTTRLSAEDAAESYFFLASAGLDANQSIAALPQVAAFAQAGMFDMATATDLLTDAQSALGLTVDDSEENLRNMTKVSDIFVRANQLANTSVQQVSEAITNKLGGSLRAAGIDLEEGVAVLAAFADQGLKGAAAGESMNIALRDLSRAARENADEFAAAGVEVFDNEGNFRNMADIIKDLEGAFGGLTAEQKANLASQLGFQDRSFKNIQLLLGTSDAVRRYEKELRSAGGATEEVAENQLDSFAGQMDLIKSRIADTGLSLGETLAPSALAAAESIADLVENLEPLIGVLGKGIELWSKLGPLQTFGKAVGRIRGIFDENVAAANRNNDILAEVEKRMEAGDDATRTYTNGLATFIDKGTLTADMMDQLASITGVTAEEMVNGTTKALDWARANSATASEVAMLEMALRDQIDALGLTADESEALKEEHGLLGSQMDRSADAVLRMKGSTEELADEQSGLQDETGETTDEMITLEEAIRATEEAQSSLADALKAMVDPTFAAVDALGKMRDAQDNLREAQESGEASAEEIAELQLELAEATLEAQGALDAFNAGSVEDQIAILADALGISYTAAKDLLDTLGLLDGQVFEAGMNVHFRATGSTAAQRAVSDRHGSINRSAGIGGIRAAGGPVSRGVPYLVGERGPEMFIPDQPGQILSNRETMRGPGGGDTHVSVTVVNPMHRDDDVVDGVSKGMQMVGMMGYAENTPGRS